MRNWIMISLLAATVTLGGCADNTFDATIDGEAQDFDEVEVSLSEAGAVYKLTVTGTSGDPAEEGSRVILHVNLSTDAVKAAELGEALELDGTATFQAAPDGAGDLSKEVSYAPSATQKAPVAAMWVEAECKDCARKGGETQAMTGTLTLEDVSDDHLTGKFTVDMTGAIPSWSKAGSLEATFEVAFDADITRP